MKEKESVLKLDRREILKLLPQTAVCLPLLPRSSLLTQFLLETASSPTGRVQPGEDEVTNGKFGFTTNWIWEPLESALKDPSARIRISGSPRFKNLFTYFRRTVALPVAVEKAAVQITGDSRYKLYVNGRYVGRGPARCDQIWQSYDEYEIAPFLKAGKNAIAVQLHFYGENTGWYMLSRPGLLFQCRLEFAGREAVMIKSDESWKFLRSSAYLQGAPRINQALGFVEIYDAREEADLWTAPEFDDSHWAAAAIVSSDSNPSDMPRVFPDYPPENLVPRGIPMLAEQEILPARVIQVGEVLNLSAVDALAPAQQMYRERIDPLASFVIENADSLVTGGGSEVVIRPVGLNSSTAEIHSAVLVLDFGHELTGYPRIELDGVEGGIVDIGVSESLLDGRVTPTRNGLHCNRYIMKKGLQAWEAFEWDGFRFMQLTVRNCSGPVTLRKVAVNFTSYPVGNRGAFESSDAVLNKIWEASRLTLQLCMHDAYEDCPNREQRQWVGDAYVETKVNYAIFGDTKLAAKFLRQIAQSQRSDGLVGMYYPGDVDPSSINIKDFVLHWVSAIWEYFRFTGDAAILGELYPKLAAAVDWFAARLGPNGLLCDVPPFIFYDWAAIDKSGESTILNALFYNVLRESAQISGVLGKHADEVRFNEFADRIKLAMNDRLWDDRRGVYVDARVGETQSRRVSQQSNSVCLLYDIASPEKRSRIVDYVFSEKRVKGWEGPSIPALITSPMGPVVRGPQHFDEETDVVRAQPYFLHWVNSALAHVGEQSRMVELIRQGFGEMIGAGATTIWETWSSDASECHGWSTTAAYDLMHYVLGIRLIDPGFAKFAIEPHVGNLQWARGKAPTVQGDISVYWESSGKEFRIEGNRPEGCAASVLIPLRDGARPKRIEMNGKTINPDEKSPGESDASMESSGTRIALRAPGHFTILASYA